MSSLFQELEEFTLFDGLVPSSGVDCGLGVEDIFDVGYVIPGDSLVKQKIGSDLLDDFPESGSGLNDDFPAPFEDALCQDWMEVSDLNTLLEVSNSQTDKAETTLTKSSGSRLLEELLTQPISIKSSPTVPSNISQSKTGTSENLSVPFATTDVVTSEGKDILEEAFHEIQGIDSGLLCQQLQEIYQSSISTDVASSSFCSDDVSIIDNSNEFSPLSSEDINSILSGSEPGSPADNSENDPDYTPYVSDESSSKKSTNKSRKSKKQKHSPYEKPLEKLDRKERKKIQNRNAALRYREKKRQERGDIHSEEEILASKNKELKTKVEQLSNEINYMKNLLTEVCEARGLKIQFK